MSFNRFKYLPHSQSEVPTLDLHRRRSHQIYELILDHIKRARQNREDIIIIVTGKGNNSDDEATLKPVTKSILTQLLNQNKIDKFGITPASLGGGGAFLVELTQNKNGK